MLQSFIIPENIMIKMFKGEMSIILHTVLDVDIYLFLSH